MKQLQYSKIY